MRRGSEKVVHKSNKLCFLRNDRVWCGGSIMNFKSEDEVSNPSFSKVFSSYPGLGIVEVQFSLNRWRYGKEKMAVKFQNNAMVESKGIRPKSTWREIQDGGETT